MGYCILCFVLSTLSTAALHCVATFHIRILTSTAHGTNLIHWSMYWSCFCNSNNKSTVIIMNYHVTIIIGNFIFPNYIKW